MYKILQLPFLVLPTCAGGRYWISDEEFATKLVAQAGVKCVQIKCITFIILTSNARPMFEVNKSLSLLAFTALNIACPRPLDLVYRSLSWRGKGTCTWPIVVPRDKGGNLEEASGSVTRGLRLPMVSRYPRNSCKIRILSERWLASLRRFTVYYIYICRITYAYLLYIVIYIHITVIQLVTYYNLHMHSLFLEMKDVSSLAWYLPDSFWLQQLQQWIEWMNVMPCHPSRWETYDKSHERSNASVMPIFWRP